MSECEGALLVTFPLPENLLQNGFWDEPWEDGRNAWCYPVGGEPYEVPAGGPRGWTLAYRNGQHPNFPAPWIKPEFRYNDEGEAQGHPQRFLWNCERGLETKGNFGAFACAWFQQLAVEPHSWLRLQAWPFAWVNSAQQGDPHHGDTHWSNDTGYRVDHWWGGDASMYFRVGIDPLGGVNPFLPCVLWSEVYHGYNGYQVPVVVDAKSRGPQVTVYLWARSVWQFRQNNAFWGGAHLGYVHDRRYPASLLLAETRPLALTV